MYNMVLFNRYLKKKQGFVLILTLMLISLLSVLAITSFELVTATTRITRNHKLYTQALYSADAGIEHTFYVLNRANWSGITWESPELLNTTLPITYGTTGSTDQGSDTWTWTYTPSTLPDPSYYWYLSHSETGNTYTVKVYLNPYNDVDDHNDHTIYVESKGTESGFEKTVVADVVADSPGKIRLYRWREKEM